MKVWGEETPEGRIVYALAPHNRIPEGATSEIKMEGFRPYDVVRVISPFGVFNYTAADKDEIASALRQLANFVENEGKN